MSHSLSNLFASSLASIDVKNPEAHLSYFKSLSVFIESWSQSSSERQHVYADLKKKKIPLGQLAYTLLCNLHPDQMDSQEAWSILCDLKAIDHPKGSWESWQVKRIDEDQQVYHSSLLREIFANQYLRSHWIEGYLKGELALDWHHPLIDQVVREITWDKEKWSDPQIQAVLDHAPLNHQPLWEEIFQAPIYNPFWTSPTQADWTIKRLQRLASENPSWFAWTNDEGQPTSEWSKAGKLLIEGATWIPVDAWPWVKSLNIDNWGDAFKTSIFQKIKPYLFRSAIIGEILHHFPSRVFEQDVASKNQNKQETVTRFRGAYLMFECLCGPIIKKG